MTELTPKISCRYCHQVFVLFEDLQQHPCKPTGFKKWLDRSDAKVRSFESVVDERLDKESGK